MLHNDTKNTLINLSELSGASAKSLANFMDKGFPTNKWEEWKYASLKSLNEVSLSWTPEPVSREVKLPLFQQALTIQSLNGHTSCLGDLPKGLSSMPLNQFLDQNAEFKALYEKRNPLLDQNSLYYLNDAFNQLKGATIITVSGGNGTFSPPDITAFEMLNQKVNQLLV